MKRKEVALGRDVLLRMELPWALGGTCCIPLHLLKQQFPLVHVHFGKVTSGLWFSQWKLCRGRLAGQVAAASLSPGDCCSEWECLEGLSCPGLLGAQRRWPHPARQGSLSQEGLDLPVAVGACRQGAGRGLVFPFILCLLRSQVFHL